MAFRLVICFADLGRQAPKERTATTKNRLPRSLNTTGPESAKAERQQKPFQQQEKSLVREAVIAVPVTASGDAVPVIDAQTASGVAVPVTEATQALPAQATPAAEVVAAQAQSPADICNILAAHHDPEPDQQAWEGGLGNAGQPDLEQPHPESDQQAANAGLGNAGRPDPKQPNGAQHTFGQHAAKPAPGGDAAAGLPMGANDAGPNNEYVAPGGGNPAEQVPPSAPAGGWWWN